MRKLQSHLDYEDSIDLPTVSDSEFRIKISNHRKFQKEILTLGMFIPVDEDGNVLEEKSIFNTTDEDYIFESESFDKYQKSLQNVIFEGFEILRDKYKETNREIICFPNTPIQVWRRLTYHSGKIETLFIDYYQDFKKIEDLIRYDLTLTETAITKYQI